MKYLRLLREFFRACLVEEFEYRANLAASVVSSVFWLAMSVLTIYVYFYRTTSVGGWSFDESLTLIGIFNAVHGFIEFVLQPNMDRLVHHIRQGTLDFVLTKPVDSQFYVSFRHLVVWRLADIALGLGVTAYAVWHSGLRPGPAEASAFIVMFLSSLVILYSLWIGMMILSFWAVKVDNLSFLFSSFFETARFPVTVYKGWLRFTLTYVFPVAFITTIPAKALLGTLTWQGAAASVGLAALFFALARAFWAYALRSYTSASS